ncbi:MAG: hypothetical protein ABEI98_00095 [Halorhabdus sp.]
MSFSDRVKAAAAKAKDRVSGSSGEAAGRAKQAASDAELSKEQKQALKRARQRAAGAVENLGGKNNASSRGPAARAGSSTNRTKEMFARAEEYATAGAPVQASIDPSPSPMGMWQFASAGNNGDPGQSASASSEPDWEGNPSNLDTAAEVQEEFVAAGLDPMNVDSAEEAEFGHFLVHSFADDRDHGGRTEAQLEAEHDMVVASLDDYGIDHSSPLDLEDISGSEAGDDSEAQGLFEFADPFNVAGGGGGSE